MNDSEVKRDLERLKKACEEVEDEWSGQILDLLKYVYDASLEKRKSEEFHHRIWDDAISEMKRDTIKVDQAIRQVKLRSWLADESMKPLPDNPQTRSDTIEKIRSDLIERVTQSGVNPRPWAKATRLLAALFPRDFTTLVSDSKLQEFITGFNESFPTIRIEPQGSVTSKHRQILERLDAALGPVPDGDLEQLAHRMILPIELIGQDKLTPEPKVADDFGERTLLPAEGTTEGKADPQNIILYGPPGTGKTYSTTQRALELLGEGDLDSCGPSQLKSLFREYQDKGRIEFVTFHQSYGYEEFVEGLRPILNEDEGNDVRYEIHDGVFKRIARRAEELDKLAAGEKPDFDYLWSRLIEKIRQMKIEKSIVESKTGIEYVFTQCSDDKVRICREENEEAGEQPHDISYDALKEDIKALWEQSSSFGGDPGDLRETKVSEILGRRIQYPVYWIVYKLLWELSQENDPPSTETPQYVLIIDEINRGNMSKILGELITLLEPDKRLGAENELRLKLPYSQEVFGVPPNLHILGTMNTADRSIALIDVALRRRFTFEERMPDAMVLEEELKRKLSDDDPLVSLVVSLFKTLNGRIRFLYDRDHQIGHSYFLNVSSLEDLRRVFVDRVIPLLQEYFYGDWHKICTVLGCPYDEQKEEQSNGSPIVKAEKFGEMETLGFDHDEYEDRVDFYITHEFQNGEMSEEKLERVFGLIVKKPKDNGTPSDTASAE